MIDFDAGLVARDVGELYEPPPKNADLRCEIDVEPNLLIHGSRELIGQAIANLVDNALKYGGGAGEKGADKSVVLSARRNGAAVEICVADHGEGIAEADRARVLDRFVRLENSRSRPGSGLGLSLAAAVARLHSGALRLEDNAPGLRVVIALPAVALTRETAQQLLLPPPEAAA